MVPGHMGLMTIPLLFLSDKLLLVLATIIILGSGSCRTHDDIFLSYTFGSRATLPLLVPLPFGVLVAVYVLMWTDCCTVKFIELSFITNTELLQHNPTVVFMFIVMETRLQAIFELTVCIEGADN
jgi:hypothetical protein